MTLCFRYILNKKACDVTLMSAKFHPDTIFRTSFVSDIMYPVKEGSEGTGTRWCFSYLL